MSDWNSYPTIHSSKVYNLVDFSAAIASFRIFSLSQEETLYSFVIIPHHSSSCHPSPKQHLIYFLSLWICLDISNKWNYMLSFVTDFFQLALCVQDIYIWWMYFIPFYSWIIFYCMAIHFVYPFVSWCGHLGFSIFRLL